MHPYVILKQATGLVRILVYGFALLVPHMSIAVFAQSCDFETERGCMATYIDTTATANKWQGPTLRVRVRLYGSFESIDPPAIAMEDSRLNDAYVRRADFTVRGSLLESVGYYFKAEFNEAELDIRDIYLNYDTRYGLFMLGLLDPIDEGVDPSYREFMESSAVEGFAPGNQFGLGYLREGENWTFFAAALKNSIDKHHLEKTGTIYSTRFTIAPPVPEGYLLHLGAYASWRKVHDGDLYRYDARSMLRVGESYVDTGKVADEEMLFGMEWGLNIGSTSFDGQCAVVRASVPLIGESPSYLNGCYLAGIWTLTGEARYYSGDGFSLLRVNKSVFDGGPGAWQIGARYDTIDLSDGTIQGGGQDTWTFSLNWYLSGQFWVSGNYSRATLKDNAFDGEVTDGWGARVHYIIEW
jgi:phosphate-selective porin OprO/OprP